MLEKPNKGGIMRYGKIGVATAMAVGAAVGYAVESGKWFITVIAVLAGVALLSLVKRRVDEVVEDERTVRVGERASRRTVEIFSIGAALSGAVMLALDLHTEAALALEFAVCCVLVLYLIFYGYYSFRALD
jgi:uncharacterized membrane protein